MLRATIFNANFLAAITVAAFRDCLNLALAPIDRAYCRFANVTDEGDA